MVTATLYAFHSDFARSKKRSVHVGCCPIGIVTQNSPDLMSADQVSCDNTDSDSSTSISDGSSDKSEFVLHPSPSLEEFSISNLETDTNQYICKISDVRTFPSI